MNLLRFAEADRSSGLSLSTSGTRTTRANKHQRQHQQKRRHRSTRVLPYLLSMLSFLALSNRGGSNSVVAVNAFSVVWTTTTTPFPVTTTTTTTTHQRRSSSSSSTQFIVERQQRTTTGTATAERNVPLVLSRRDDRVVKTNDPNVAPRKSTTYDLGLGRHRPFIGDTTTTNHIPDDVMSATQYLVEHESIREYPSPLSTKPATITRMMQHQQQQQESSLSDSTSTGNLDNGEKQQQQRRRQIRHPPLIPIRITDDEILTIRQMPSVPHMKPQSQQATAMVASSPKPVVVVQKSNLGNQFDINTAWMELLIHEQQQQLSSSSLSANNRQPSLDRSVVAP